jgi:hypothetical protein
MATYVLIHGAGDVGWYIAPDAIDGGHCIVLSRPKELAERLDAHRRPSLT